MSSAQEIYERIERRREAIGLPANAVGLAAGMSRDALRTMRRAIEDGRQTRVTTHTLEKLAPVLRTTVQWLATGEGPEELENDVSTIVNGTTDPTPVQSLGEASAELADHDPPRTFNFRRDVPVMGTAAGSVIRSVEGFALDRDVVDYVRRPPALKDRKDVYAIYVSGLSMDPLHIHGDLRFVDPVGRAMIGDSVIVVTRTHDDDPGQAYIKILTKRTPERLVLRQLNPEAVVEIPNKYILSVHKVLTLNDLFGV